MKSILLHEEEKKEEEEEEENEEECVGEEEELKEELKRLNIKTIKPFNRTLYLKKKNIIVNSYPILSQKNEDFTVIAENKFREIKIIFISKKIAIEKVTSIKEEISDLELMEFRYRNEVRRLENKKKITNKKCFK